MQWLKCNFLSRLRSSLLLLFHFLLGPCSKILQLEKIYEIRADQMQSLGMKGERQILKFHDPVQDKPKTLNRDWRACPRRGQQ
jgi:hypothetical protein